MDPVNKNSKFNGIYLKFQKSITTKASFPLI